MVGIPRGELGYGMFQAHLEAIPDYGYLVSQGRVISQPGGYTHSQPTAIIDEALHNKNRPPWSRFMWLEHDHYGPTDMFRRHALYSKPIVSGLYVFRDAAEPIPVIYKWDDSRQSAAYYNAEELKAMGLFEPDLNSPKRGLHKVDVVPMGCLSVSRDVFEGWPKDRPFFSSGTTPSGKTIGHDVFFARIAQDEGWPIYVDTSLRIKHFAFIELDDSYFLRWYEHVRLPQVLKEAEERAAKALEAEGPRLELVK